jgi:hypothetical protein
MARLAGGHGATVLLAAHNVVISSVTFLELDLFGRIWTHLHVFWRHSRITRPQTQIGRIPLTRCTMVGVNVKY